MVNKVYTLSFPRPCGVAPIIYLEYPKITPEVIEIEPGYFLTDPYTDPEILEHDTIYYALKYIVEFNSTNDYLKDLKILNRVGEEESCG